MCSGREAARDNARRGCVIDLEEARFIRSPEYLTDVNLARALDALTDARMRGDVAAVQGLSASLGGLVAAWAAAAR